jgi:hypothetical protein
LGAQGSGKEVSPPFWELLFIHTNLCERMMRQARFKLNFKPHDCQLQPAVPGEGMAQITFGGPRGPVVLIKRKILHDECVTMTEARAIETMIAHLQGLFPKTCPNCGRRFVTLRDFILNTTPIGKPIAHDLEMGELNPLHPIGAVAVSNCPCGTSLALTSEGMPLFRFWGLLLWAKRETQRRGQTPQELLQYVRGEIRKQVLAESEEL